MIKIKILICFNHNWLMSIVLCIFKLILQIKKIKYRKMFERKRLHIVQH